MDEVKKMTDEELLARFKEFGYTFGPVTRTTRSVLERKLANLILEAQKTGKKTARRILRLSSLSSEEEGSDPEVTIPSSGTRNYSRKKIPGTPPRPNRSRDISEKKKRAGVTTAPITSAGIDSLITVRRSLRNVFDSKPSKRVDPFKGEFEGSDSDTVEPRYLFRRSEPSTSGIRYGQIPTNQPSSSGYSYRNDEASEPGTSGYSYRHDEASKPGTSGIRFRHVPLSQSNTSTTGNKLYTALNRLLRPFGSVFNVFKRRPIAGSTRHNENNGFIPMPSTSYGADGDTYFQTTDDRGWFSRNYQVVSQILVIFMLMFFALLAVSYATISLSRPMYMSETHLPICESNTTVSQNPTVNCIPINRIREVTKLMKKVYNILYDKSWDASCSSLYGNTQQNYSLLTDYELMKDLKTKYPEYKSADLLRDIRYLKILILSNPHWQIVLKNKNNENLNINTTRGELAKSSGITFKEVKVPVTCYVWYTCSMIVKAVVYFVFWFLLAILVCKLLAWYIQYVQNHKEKVNVMVNRIVTFVRSRYQIHVLAGTRHQFAMPIDYVRDQLIPEAERKHSVVIWTSAVNYINRKEPRLKQDVVVVNGENKAVWLWNPEQDDFDPASDSGRSVTPQLSSTSRAQIPITGNSSEQQLHVSAPVSRQSSRTWQGQAFETMAGCPNSAPNSPSPCLKIRHMFNPDVEHEQDWHISIQDAVLTKCEGVSVLHLYVDKTSREGCVYMKCKTPEDAGRAYCALHGWWFGNSQLVTVKYLRVERYHERFPEAVNATHVLQPSSFEEISMQN